MLMAEANHSSRPVQVLREMSTALEASILLCLASPRKEAVHRLRTATRRVEAQLALLSMLPELPPHDKQQTKALRLLKKLRHAAGRVRDIDVQRELIHDIAAKDASTSHPDHSLGKQAHLLRSDLEHHRDAAADELLQVLHKQQSQLPLAIEDLLDTLAPANSITLSEAHLTMLIRGWFGVHNQAQPSASLSTAELHTLRKRAKIARYISESAPESAVKAHRLAVRFERLQQAGGTWHDMLILAELATHKLGHSALLPQHLATQADHSLRAFQRRLRYKI